MGHGRRSALIPTAAAPAFLKKKQKRTAPNAARFPPCFSSLLPLRTALHAALNKHTSLLFVL